MKKLLFIFVLSLAVQTFSQEKADLYDFSGKKIEIPLGWRMLSYKKNKDDKVEEINLYQPNSVAKTYTPDYKLWVRNKNYVAKYAEPVDYTLFLYDIKCDAGEFRVIKIATFNSEGEKLNGGEFLDRPLEKAMPDTFEEKLFSKACVSN